MSGRDIRWVRVGKAPRLSTVIFVERIFRLLMAAPTRSSSRGGQEARWTSSRSCWPFFYNRFVSTKLTVLAIRLQQQRSILLLLWLSTTYHFLLLITSLNSKKMFPDSKIAKGFACGRTKTTAIVKCALAPALNAEVIAECQKSPFTILCDGNDVIENYFAIMVRYWSQSARQSVTRFLCMPVCNSNCRGSLLKHYPKNLSHVTCHGATLLGMCLIHVVL